MPLQGEGGNPLCKGPLGMEMVHVSCEEHYNSLEQTCTFAPLYLCALVPLCGTGAGRLHNPCILGAHVSFRRYAFGPVLLLGSGAGWWPTQQPGHETLAPAAAGATLVRC
jgi:hypothetical protein